MVLSATQETETTGHLQGFGLTAPCVFGRSGLVANKAESDGATPIGAYRLRSCYWRPDRGPRPLTGLPAIAIRPDLGWCDDPQSPLYNRPVRLPFGPSHERMWREDRAYDVVVVLDQNMDPAVPGEGSAIFWHLTKMDVDPTPTEGCVAVAPDPMRAFLARCDARTVMRIGPA